jgi:DNA-binding PadR family transcriptional regulator
MPEYRMTQQTQQVLREFLKEPDKKRYCLDVCDPTELPPGTVYPILLRFERAGWLDSAWEDPAVYEAAGRPPRRYYWLTPDGAENARTALARAYQPRSRRIPGQALTQPAIGGAPA